ncbi:hypothetical protein GCM10025771_27640 [Niveibacterium umoris]|uniref:Excisionase family DNA binding protein n=1 Tax=Niveibacterium umoris TaxID=1193620 RepID=A0A840BHB6_9RHOO|nr:helix-turn-helix domain-containing protein [Niveibacterium umoris]MBB4012043.1 excisionase family DNA binding protein [Niveibacterium umoris]
MQDNPKQFPQGGYVPQLRYLIDLKRTQAVLGVSRAKVYDMLAKGELPAPVKVGASTRFYADEIAAFIDALPRATKGGVQ